jgi:hypothetical protein
MTGTLPACSGAGPRSAAGSAAGPELRGGRCRRVKQAQQGSRREPLKLPPRPPQLPSCLLILPVQPKHHDSIIHPQAKY